MMRFMLLIPAKQGIGNRSQHGVERRVVPGRRNELRRHEGIGLLEIGIFKEIATHFRQ